MINNMKKYIIASLILLGTMVSLPVSAVENKVQPSSYWYPDEKEIEKQTLCDEFDSKYTEMPDLIERYSAYCKINNSEESAISRLWLEENGDSYSQFAYTNNGKDKAEIHLYIDPDKSPDIEEIYSVVSVQDVPKITIEKYERMDYITQGGVLKPVPTGEYYNAVTLNFASTEHEKNVTLTMKAKDKLKEEFKVSHFGIDFDFGAVSYNKRIDWSTLYKVDEFGTEIPLSEELTEKQIDLLNDEFKESGYNVSYDAETYTLNFNSEMDVYEHFDFAEYLYETYGFYSKTFIPYIYVEDSYLGSYYIEDFESPCHHKEKSYTDMANAKYSDMLGDLDGDNDVYISDLNMMSNWLLGANPENSDYVKMPNPQNSDLNSDGRLDVYDLILLREMAS